MLFTLITLIVFACFLCSLYFLRNRETVWWRHFRWYLLLATLVEGSGYCLYFIYGIKNHALFNLFLPVGYLFTGWVMWQLGASFYPLRIWLLCGLAIVLCIYLYESITARFAGYSTTSTIAASIFFTMASGLYFYYLNRLEGFVHLRTYAPFWLVAGIFIFYFCSTAMNFFFNYFASLNSANPFQLKLTRYKISIFLNFILYASWAYAFLCRQRQITSARSFT